MARTAFVDVAATTLAGAAQPVGRIVTGYVREGGGAPLQRAIDVILNLRARHGLDPAAVREIRVGVSYLFPGVLIRTDPQTGLEGKPSLEFCAAVAMLDGRLGLDAFTGARVREPRRARGQVLRLRPPQA